MKLNSRTPSNSEFDALRSAIADYPVQLGLDISSKNAAEIQKWIFDKLMNMSTLGLTRAQEEDLAFWLAMAWGETLVHALDWEWVFLEAADKPEMKAIAVASPARSYAVPVVQFLAKLATGAQADQTSELLFNMIIAGALPHSEAGELKLLA